MIEWWNDNDETCFFHQLVLQHLARQLLNLCGQLLIRQGETMQFGGGVNHFDTLPKYLWENTHSWHEMIPYDSWYSPFVFWSSHFDLSTPKTIKKLTCGKRLPKMIPSHDVFFESWAAAYSLWEKSLIKPLVLCISHTMFHTFVWKIREPSANQCPIKHNQTDMEKKQGSVKIVSPWIPALYEIN